jgi:hypothetical protein
MQSKSTPDPAPRILTDLRNTLMSLHKALLDSERGAYERDVARVSSPGQMLDLLMNDPWFAYLRELSQFIVLVDEILDADEPVSLEEANGLVSRASQLLKPSPEANGFRKRYYDAMQRDPGVVLAHAATTKVIARLRPA